MHTASSSNTVDFSSFANANLGTSAYYSYEEKQRFKQMEDDQFEATQMSIQQLMKLEKMAIGFVERMKIENEVEDEFEMMNTVYNLLLDGINIDAVEDIVAGKSRYNPNITAKNLLGVLSDLEDDVQQYLENKSKRVHYCLDDSKKEYNTLGELVAERKIWVSQHPITQEIDVYEVGYTPTEHRDEYADQLELNGVKLENVRF